MARDHQVPGRRQLPDTPKYEPHERIWPVNSLMSIITRLDELKQELLRTIEELDELPERGKETGFVH